MQPNIDQLNLFPPAPEEIKDLIRPVDSIGGELIGPEPGADLVESVRRLGVLQPILVRMDKGSKPYAILDGRRRLKAAKKAGIDEVPIRVVPASYVHHETVTIQANTARRANPISEYVAIRSLLDKGFDEKFIAKELGIKAAVVKQRIGLSNLIPDLFGLLEGGHIATSVGESIAKLSHPLQEQLLAKYAEKDSLTMDDVKSVKKAKAGETEKSLSDILFDGDSKKPQDVESALRHLDAAAELLKVHGIAVDWESLRSEVQAHAKT